ncbi:hypothetical protein BDK51DRAFT_33982 [Blyttiomyces helicus]|uniref:Uncharacterized protein n=1 Tax=Blyttiomyces helicus TaxID=388810 RepID=A0A4P9W7U8_9FUNG|nr:hypothetical protein BDK51DRAFT_33982 [Blyttiomyces helicus]|eukprot:RKO88172.1 hypothetical protein BDK51DRAFT_33982 [Blyttiomyces helicus]
MVLFQLVEGLEKTRAPKASGHGILNFDLDNEIYDLDSTKELSELQEEEKYEAGKKTLQLKNNSAPVAVYEGGKRDEEEGGKSYRPEKVFAEDGKEVAEGLIYGQVTKERTKASDSYSGKACRRYQDEVHVAHCGKIIGWSHDKGRSCGGKRSEAQCVAVGENSDAKEQSPNEKRLGELAVPINRLGYGVTYRGRDFIAFPNLFFDFQTIIWWGTKV